MKYIILIFLFLYSCDNKKICPKNYFENIITHYQVDLNKITKSGFKVDTSGFDIDLNKLDERLLNIEKCLYEIYKENPLLADEEVVSGECLEKDLHISQTIDRDCFNLKIVEPVFSKCSDYQFIRYCETCDSAYANPQYCIDKGIIPTEECPCLWRLAIQNNDNDNVVTLITPPSIYLWDTIRNVTMCNNIWKIPYNICTQF